MTRNTHILSMFFVIASVFPAACGTVQNYQDPNEPFYAGNYADTPSNFNGQIKILTWNIKFSEEIDTAIDELSTVDELQGAEIILLQEMDEKGLEAIARSLSYNYVYFPASVHSHHGKNFGNAILAKRPISDPAKILLPHANPKNKQTRIAVRALVSVGEVEVPVYSIHTETAWLSQQKRSEQIEILLQDIGEDSEHVIVGGDFNTFTAKSIVELEKRFERIGLDRMSTGAGHTFEKNGFGFALDHIFARGLSATDNGAWQETEASDHFPLWVNMMVE